MKNPLLSKKKYLRQQVENNIDTTSESHYNPNYEKIQKIEKGDTR